MILNSISIILIVAGLFFYAVGILGILRFPDFYTRVQAAGNRYRTPESTGKDGEASTTLPGTSAALQCRMAGGGSTRDRGRLQSHERKGLASRPPGRRR